MSAALEPVRRQSRAQMEVALLERIAKKAKAAKPKSATAAAASASPRKRGRPPKARERIDARAKHGKLRQDPAATFMKHVRVIAVRGAEHWLWGGGAKYKMYEDGGTKLAQYRTPACHALRLFGAGNGPVPPRLLPPRLAAVCGVEGCIHPEHTRATGHPDLCFWPRVDKSERADGSGCWLWQGSTDKFGYGRVQVDGQHGLAHRLSYRVAFGKLDEAKEVLQICGNRRCVRPEHLCLGASRRRGRRLSSETATSPT